MTLVGMTYLHPLLFRIFPSVLSALEGIKLRMTCLKIGTAEMDAHEVSIPSIRVELGGVEEVHPTVVRQGGYLLCHLQYHLL